MQRNFSEDVQNKKNSVLRSISNEKNKRSNTPKRQVSISLMKEAYDGKKLRKSDRSISLERKDKKVIDRTNGRKPEKKNNNIGGGLSHHIADRLDILEKMYEEFSKK